MVTVSLYHDTRRIKDDGTYPVKIRIGVGRKAHLIKTSISLIESDFQKVITSKNLDEDLKRFSKRLKKLTDKANELVDIVDPFIFETFERLYFQNGDRSDLLFLLREKADQFEEDEKYSSMNLYRQAAMLLEKYVIESKKKSKVSVEIPLTTVTPNWLRAFEKWALSQKKISKSSADKSEALLYSATTLSMYLIRVRSVFNDCISAKELDPSFYPFHKPDNKNGYKIPRPSGSKRPLTKIEINAIYRFETRTRNQAFHKALFMFSYLASGMNMADILTLKWKDVEENHFTFVRRKTVGKLTTSAKITVPVNKQLKAILDEFGTERKPENRVFEAVPNNASEKEIKRIVSSYIAGINANLKKIALKLGITDKISTYFARHSYSNNLMNAEAPIAFISKQLGHQDIKTTQAYLDSFSNDQAAKYQDNLLDDDDE